MPYESDPIAAKLNELVAANWLYIGLEDFDELSMAERAIVGTWELVNEVYNGGFMQYFRNSSGERAVPMVEVLRAIGAFRPAEILGSAIALVGPGTPCGDAQNFITAAQSLPADLRGKISDLERQLYDELDDLHLRLFRYLSQHREQIDAPEGFWTEEAAP